MVILGCGKVDGIELIFGFELNLFLIIFWKRVCLWVSYVL